MRASPPSAKGCLLVSSSLLSQEQDEAKSFTKHTAHSCTSDGLSADRKTVAPRVQVHHRPRTEWCIRPLGSLAHRLSRTPRAPETRPPPREITSDSLQGRASWGKRTRAHTGNELDANDKTRGSPERRTSSTRKMAFVWHGSLRRESARRLRPPRARKAAPREKRNTAEERGSAEDNFLPWLAAGRSLRRRPRPRRNHLGLAAADSLQIKQASR